MKRNCAVDRRIRGVMTRSSFPAVDRGNVYYHGVRAGPRLAEADHQAERQICVLPAASGRLEQLPDAESASAFTITPTGGKAQVGVVAAQIQTTVNMDSHTVFLAIRRSPAFTFPRLIRGTRQRWKRSCGRFSTRRQR